MIIRLTREQERELGARIGQAMMVPVRASVLPVSPETAAEDLLCIQWFADRVPAIAEAIMHAVREFLRQDLDAQIVAPSVLQHGAEQN